MKILVTRNIFIAGKFTAAGTTVEVDDKTAENIKQAGKGTLVSEDTQFPSDPPKGKEKK